jgi:hypothetical protein
MSTHGPRQWSTRGHWWGPCVWSFQVSFTNVHFWQSPRVDICKVHAQTSLSSRVWGCHVVVRYQPYGKLQ